MYSHLEGCLVWHIVYYDYLCKNHTSNSAFKYWKTRAPFLYVHNRVYFSPCTFSCNKGTKKCDLYMNKSWEFWKRLHVVKGRECIRQRFAQYDNRVCFGCGFECALLQLRFFLTLFSMSSWTVLIMNLKLKVWASIWSWYVFIVIMNQT